MRTGFSLGDNIKTKCMVMGMKLGETEFYGKICGKIKGSDSYIVCLNGYNYKDDYVYKSLLRRFGYPIRQIDLEWGFFHGIGLEFIIPEHEMELLNG